MARKVSASEILRHANPDDAWIVVDGNVYDMTDFAASHPGGPESTSTAICSQPSIARRLTQLKK
jgi:cytochrome b involved in lipid metabolism